MGQDTDRFLKDPFSRTSVKYRVSLSARDLPLLSYRFTYEIFTLFTFHLHVASPNGSRYMHDDDDDDNFIWERTSIRIEFPKISTSHWFFSSVLVSFAEGFRISGKEEGVCTVPGVRVRKPLAEKEPLNNGLPGSAAGGVDREREKERKIGTFDSR